MILTIIGILLILWVLGVIAHIGGGLIHLLLVVALIVWLVDLVNGRTKI